MKYYLLSGMDENNEYNFYSNISEIFKKELKKYKKIVYIPTYPENEEKCEKLSKTKIFENIGIKFEESIVLNNVMSTNEIKEIISENELIFLYGGDPYKQIDFIKKNDIQNLLRNKIIIGLSAGSINMCKKAICTKDEDFQKSDIYKGMGFLEFSIEPHFNINNVEVLEDLKRFSKETNIYALEDDAYMIIEDNNINFIGNIYNIKNGEIRKI